MEASPAMTLIYEVTRQISASGFELRLHDPENSLTNCAWRQLHASLPPSRLSGATGALSEVVAAWSENLKKKGRGSKMGKF